MTDTMREMIAQLMGTQREEEEGRDLIPYDHPSVCKAYLIGCCPYDLVPDSRLQGLLSCVKVHEPAHKADYLKAQEKKDHYYDVDAFLQLENAVSIVDGEVERIKGKLEREAKEQNESADVVKTQKLAELDEKINKAMEEVESLGSAGKVEESLRVAKTIEELRERKTEIENQNEFRMVGPGSNASRLRVCEDCGAQLNILDHESRIADHFGGKMHLGMVEVRERYTSMKDTIEARRKERRDKLGDRHEPVFTPRFMDRERERERRFSPRRDRDRRDDRDREYDRRRRSRSPRDRDRRRDRDDRSNRSSSARGSDKYRERDRDRRDRR